MESPKFIVCPECNQRYNDTTKRRLIDTCGHPRCYSCLFKDNPCPVCTKLPQERQRARTLSNEKLLEHGEVPRYQRLHSDNAAPATFTGMFRKGESMKEKIRKYRSLEILNERTRTGRILSDVCSETFLSAMQDNNLGQFPDSSSSSVDELDEDSPKSPPVSPQDVKKDHAVRPKAWPSCPDLSMKENVWQMRQSNFERLKRPSSLNQIKYSSSSPRGSIYSPRSSGYWSELEQLSESETFSPTRKLESPSAPTQDNHKPPTELITEAQKAESEEPDNKSIGAWQMTHGVFQQGKFKANHTRSTEYIPRDFDYFRSKMPQRINSMPVERHTKKILENNTQRKAFMTDV